MIGTELLGEIGCYSAYFFVTLIPPGNKTTRNLVVIISAAFSEEQTSLIRDSAKHYYDRIYSPTGLQQAAKIARTTTLTFPRRNELIFHNGAGDKLTVAEYVKLYITHSFAFICAPREGQDSSLAASWSPYKWRQIIIDCYEKEATTDPTTGQQSFELGRGGINQFTLINGLHIYLNSRFLNSDTPFPNGKNPDLWAGVIAHEIMHNLGYEHGSDANGTYIGTVQNCIAGSGITPSLSDSKPDYTITCGTTSKYSGEMY